MKQIHGYFFLFCLVILVIQCGQKRNDEQESKSIKSTYTLGSFKEVQKIDTHVHFNSNSTIMIDLAKEYNFQLLNISVGFGDWNGVDRQLEVRQNHFHSFPETIPYCTAFSMEGWDEEGWENMVIERLRRDFEKGALGVKIWKNIGMEIRDKNGDLIFISDERFDPIFQFIEDQGKVLLSHAGEPKNCWLPLDSMTVKNDYNYFKAHPQYHMYKHPDLPSYEDQIAHRDKMLSKHPNLKFIGVHMASLEWSVDRLSAFLDRFPNASVDLAERVSHTQYQSQRDREKVRDFFIKYQDRILYATDFQHNPDTDEAAFQEYMMETWMNDWKYFNTDQMIQVPQLDEPVQGLALPKQVVDKIYRLNALKIFPEFSTNN